LRVAAIDRRTDADRPGTKLDEVLRSQQRTRNGTHAVRLYIRFFVTSSPPDKPASNSSLKKVHNYLFHTKKCPRCFAQFSSSGHPATKHTFAEDFATLR
jgi:hypothetical protein